MNLVTEEIMTDKHFRQEYMRLAHAIQSAVGWDQELNPGGDNIKHLRTGLNMLFVGEETIRKILVDKGICTEEEYNVVLLSKMEAEVERYKKIISEKLGRDVYFA